jgi:hypothetical protein
MQRLFSLKFVFLIFIAVYLVTVIYLFYPVFQCTLDFRGYVTACDDGLSLFIIPFAIFTIIWGIVLAVSIAIVKLRSKV